jgi:hypothetical protein
MIRVVLLTTGRRHSVSIQVPNDPQPSPTLRGARLATQLPSAVRLGGVSSTPKAVAGPLPNRAPVIHHRDVASEGLVSAV